MLNSFGSSEAVELYYVESWTILVVSMIEKSQNGRSFLSCLFEIRKPWIQLHAPHVFLSSEVSYTLRNSAKMLESSYCY